MADGRNQLVSQLSEEHRAELLKLAARVTVPAGTVIVHEGDPADHVFMIVSGEMEVSKRVDGEQHVVATLGADEYFGEMALLDAAPRSATVRATKPSELLSIDMGTLNDVLSNAAYASLVTAMYRRLAEVEQQRLRSTSDVLVGALRDRLREVQRRQTMAMALIGIVVVIAGYMVTLDQIRAYANLSTTNEALVALGLGASAVTGSILLMVRQKMAPLSAFGLTLHNLWPALRVTLLYTAAACAAIVGIKLAVVSLGGQRAAEPLFAMRSTPVTWAIYALAAPIQELTARGCLQSLITDTFVSRWAPVWGLLLSNLLFASVHVHHSPGLVYGSLLLGLVMGAAWIKHRNLIAVCVGHFVLGVWALDVVGIGLK